VTPPGVIESFMTKYIEAALLTDRRNLFGFTDAYDRRTDRDRFTMEVPFIRAGEDLLAQQEGIAAPC
jgi:hypothetical protein